MKARCTTEDRKPETRTIAAKVTLWVRGSAYSATFGSPVTWIADSVDQQFYSLKAERLATVSIIGC
jgi:hypothetical protein